MLLYVLLYVVKDNKLVEHGLWCNGENGNVEFFKQCTVWTIIKVTNIVSQYPFGIFIFLLCGIFWLILVDFNVIKRRTLG
jgi:hypothetical protein